MDIAGKLALVTGGSDGIGLWIARILKRKGAAVIVCGRDQNRLAAAADEGLEALAADLSTAEGCRALATALQGRPLDLLVNNAGTSSAYDVTRPIDLAANDRAIFLNLNAPVHLVALLLPGLLARPEAAIVNVTSGLAIAPRAGAPVYCATKAGLRSFTKALRHQLRGTRVRVLEALPPVVATAMTAGRPGSKMQPEHCARAIVKAIEKEHDEANVGLTRVLKLVHSVSPALAGKIMLRF